MTNEWLIKNDSSNNELLILETLIHLILARYEYKLSNEFPRDQWRVYYFPDNIKNIFLLKNDNIFIMNKIKLTCIFSLYILSLCLTARSFI